MMDFDATTRLTSRFSTPTSKTGGQVVTIFDAALQPRTIELSSFRKNVITFGREDTPGVNDIILTSPLVSRKHGRFVCVDGKWRIEDTGSTNGLICNDANIRSREISDGDFVRIDDGIQTVAAGVLFAFSSGTVSANQWQTLDITREMDITIGRSPDCKLVLPHVSVSKHHARIVREGSHFVIYDNGSTNGVIVNGRRITGREILNEKDIINITNSKIIFTSSMISYCCCKNGITVDASNVVIRRGKGRKSFITCNSVSLNIQPGELVAIIGGSGAGKSTVLNAMCGYLRPTKGHVYINGLDLYQNFDSLKKLVGYVPQSDIVYDNLTLYDMLKYTAKLRLPKDTSEKEMENAIARAIATVELTEKKNSFIKALSGGQRKRASIAVELLSDPNLLFLDEPASGLDPGTERNLMVSLREMANSGKTIILVTHSTLQLKLCDKIVFMGKGGNLCFYGSYDEALKFFGVDDIVDVYRMITDNAPMWRDKYAATVAALGDPRSKEKRKTKKPKKYRMKQFGVMAARYAKLIFNDRARLLLMLCMPLITLALGAVKTGSEFEQYEATSIMLFILVLISFMVGIFCSIQEICKERTILRREYMAGSSLTSYVMSKFAVLGGFSIIQSAVITGLFCIFFSENLPDSILFPDSNITFLYIFEAYIIILLTMLSSIALGLFVSSIFNNAEKVMTIACFILAAQIILSGIIFRLDGDILPVAAMPMTCHWAVRALGNGVLVTGMISRQNIHLCLGNSTDTGEYPHVFQSFEEYHNCNGLCEAGAGNYEDFTAACRNSWFMEIGVLVLFIIGFIILTRICLHSITKEKS